MTETDARQDSWVYFQSGWASGNPAIMGPMDHGFWQASLVFDGARAFEGVAPDLDRHCQRLIRSAEALGLKPTRTAAEIETLVWQGIARFEEGAELYIRPMFWAVSGFVEPDPASTEFALAVYRAPLPKPLGLSVTLSPFRRPSFEYAPTNAKAACLYPNAARALGEARARGFDNAVMLDPLGHVAELATANIWLVKSGVAATPIPNGCLLDGITRQRVLLLLREAGIEVKERTIDWQNLLEADEIFTTGNYSKLVPVTRIEGRSLQSGPIAAMARRLYWDFAHQRL